MNPNPDQPNTAGMKIGLPNSSNKGFDVKAGMIDSNPTAPYNPNNAIPNNRIDSKDEIVYELKHKLCLKDTIMYIIWFVIDISFFVCFLI